MRQILSKIMDRVFCRFDSFDGFLVVHDTKVAHEKTLGEKGPAPYLERVMYAVNKIEKKAADDVS